MSEGYRYLRGRNLEWRITEDQSEAKFRRIGNTEWVDTVKHDPGLLSALKKNELTEFFPQDEGVEAPSIYKGGEKSVSELWRKRGVRESETAASYMEAGQTTLAFGAKDRETIWLECSETISTLERELAAKTEELAKIRKLFPEILEALGSGACTEDVSLEFLSHIPNEVRLVMEKKDRELARLRGALLRAEQAIYDQAYTGTEKLRELGCECDSAEKTAAITLRKAQLFGVLDEIKALNPSPELK